ncbi:MAG: CBS domain-containing protein [Ignavibacteria bacterium]|nr:CBS domain-containing protein [Ignavibacteria bacterium]
MKKTQNELFNEKIETKLKTSTGKQIDVLLDISPIFFMNNSGIVINVKDITINKEIREALDYTKEKYIALTNQISIGVFRTTADKRAQFTEVNPALLEILGEKSANDVLSKSILDFFYGTEDDFLENLFNDGFIKNKIVRIKKVDGIISTVSISAVLVKNINGDLQSIDGIIEDITEQCKTDKEKDELITDLQTSVLTLNQKISPFTKNLPSCNYNSSILEIAKIMTDYNTNSILVKGNNDEEIGIITDHDIMTRVISTGKDINDPAYSIMTAPIISIKSTATIYDALLLFREKKVRHIAVKSNSNMVIGVVDLDDIFSSTFSNYIFFIEKIASAKDVKHLIENRNNLIQLVKNLLKSNINIRTINKINSLITDSITKKIISFAITKLGPPPCEFAFITLGSDGREEQTFLTDQDNAIIYDDVDEEKLEIVSNYFLNLGKMISNDLNEVGYFYCKGNIMASNVKFCQPISVWKKYFTGWITNANPQDLLDLKIFFDFRHIEGQKELSSQLHKHISHLLKSCDPFFVYLADNIVKYQLPDSMIKMKSAIDLKLILLPIVDFTRLYSLKNNINTSNTLERLEYIHDGGFLSYNLYSSLLLLYNLIMQRRLLHQLECLDSNKPADNSVHPQFLSEIELFLLKRYFELLDELKNKINLDFKGTLIR